MQRQPLIRLVSVQGPLQLLSALAVLFYKQDTIKDKLYKDYLIIHGLCMRPPTDTIIKKAIYDIAKAWPWEKIVLLDEFERYLGPFDGHASERCNNLIEKFIAAWKSGACSGQRNNKRNESSVRSKKNIGF